MKRLCSLMLAVMIIFSLSLVTFADPDQTLDDIINSQNQSQSQVVENTDTTTTTGTATTGTGETFKEQAAATQDKTGGKKFMEGMNQASDLTRPNIDGTDPIISGATTVAAFIVQVLSYVIILFLAVRVLLDLAFIALPFTRTFLANGYSGQAQASGQGMMNPGMGGGMMGGGMGMGGMGMGGGYGHGRYGGMGGMGMGGMNQMGGMGMQGQMAGQNAMMNRNSSMVGNVQFVSNAALNAVATESAIGPDGKTQSPFKIYFKDMAITLIITPILIVLAATGVVTQFGLVIAQFLVGFIQKAGTMI